VWGEVKFTAMSSHLQAPKKVAHKNWADCAVLPKKAQSRTKNICCATKSRTKYTLVLPSQKGYFMSNKFATYNSKRTRNWSVIFWVDDLPDDWLVDVKALGFKWSLSPAHDKCLWTEENEKNNPEHKAGTAKKKHHHAIFMFPSQKTLKQMCELFGGIFGFGNDSEESVKGVQFQKCDSTSGSVQYFVHMNHPKKTQYNTEDIQGFNGFDVEKHLKHDPTQLEMREMLNHIEQIIKYNDITELDDLVELLREESDKTYLDAVRTNHRHYFRDFLNSRRGKKNEEIRKQFIIDEFLKKHGYRYDPQADRIFHV
jgi:hypothetical protein